MFTPEQFVSGDLNSPEIRNIAQIEEICAYIDNSLASGILSIQSARSDWTGENMKIAIKQYIDIGWKTFFPSEYEMVHFVAPHHTHSTKRSTETRMHKMTDTIQTIQKLLTSAIRCRLDVESRMPDASPAKRRYYEGRISSLLSVMTTAPVDVLNVAVAQYLKEVWVAGDDITNAGTSVQWLCGRIQAAQDVRAGGDEQAYGSPVETHSANDHTPPVRPHAGSTDLRQGR